jgi:hypothetical protein
VSEAKKKNPDDLPIEFRSLVRVAPKLGDKRVITKRFKKGQQIAFAEYEAPFIFEATSTMDVTEEYKKLGEYNTPAWHEVSYKTETAKRVPTKWERLRVWLGFQIVSIPQARTVRR